MSFEIEAKLRVDSHEPVRERLRVLGATPIETVREWNEIFDRPDGSLRRAGYGLRVRSVAAVVGLGQRATLTVKGPETGGAFKSREEREIEIDDATTAARILAMLGFVSILRYEKRRESWSWRECRIELDSPPHLGLFVEVEGPTDATIRAVRSDLGLDRKAHCPASYVRMLTEYCDKHGIADRTLHLPDDTASNGHPARGNPGP